MTADDVEILDRPRRQPEDPVPRRRLLRRRSPASTTWPAARPTDLSGVKVVDPYTVEITLSQPDATFLHVMALNFASVVPKEDGRGSGRRFRQACRSAPAPSSSTEWTLGQRLVFERNPDYYRKGVPYLDKITFEIGQEPIVALLRLQKGEVDIPGDGIPPAKFLEVMDDPDAEGSWSSTATSCTPATSP